PLPRLPGSRVRVHELAARPDVGGGASRVVEPRPVPAPLDARRAGLPGRRERPVLRVQPPRGPRAGDRPRGADADLPAAGGRARAVALRAALVGVVRHRAAAAGRLTPPPTDGRTAPLSRCRARTPGRPV